MERQLSKFKTFKTKQTNHYNNKQTKSKRKHEQKREITEKSREDISIRQVKQGKFDEKKSNSNQIKHRKVKSTSKVSDKTLPVIFASAPLQSNFIQVSILGKTINTLVDTGSSLSCIQKSLLNSLDQEFVTYGTSEFKKVKGIGGHLISITGTAILPVQIGDQIFHQKFYIFDEILHPLLLGIDFLKTNNCTLNFEHQTLDSDAGTPVVNLLGANSAFATGLARPLKRTVIQPHSETVIPIKISRLSHQQTTLFEPTNLLTRKKLAGAKAVLSVNHGRGFCRILNPMSSPVTLRPSQVIGKLSPVHTDSIVELNLNQNDSEPSVNSATSSDSANDANLENKYEQYRKTVDDLGISLEESDLSESQKLKLYEFIAMNRSSFAKDTSELGCTNVHKHKIDTGNAPPQRKRPYRVSPKVKQEIDEQIEDMLKNDIIEPSNSFWAAPVVMCRKKDNSYRFAVDYRDLNSVTEPMNFPLPRMEDVMDSVGENNSKIFTVLDLKAGFHQIPLDEETKHKTTFITHKGCYSFKRLPYGLRNAPIAFQAVMAQVLQGINFKYALVYVDDILIHSANFEEHLVHLQNVFDRLSDANLKLQPKKCQFAAKRVEYLGHYFSKNGIQVNPSKIQVVKTYPVPKTRKQVKSILGLCNYYRRFVQDYAKIAGPLNNLLRKDVDYQWTSDCDKAFNVLKQKLISAPILAFADMQKPFFLSVDASGSAIGYILGQHDSENREVAVSYGGRALRGTELKWNVCERECLALVEAIKQFHPYLSHNHFTVYSDNIALKWLQKIRDQNGRLGRWSIKLQGYNFTVIHKPGIKNQNADSLSRRPYADNEPNSKACSEVNSMKLELARDGDLETLVPKQYMQIEFEYENPMSDPFSSALQQLPSENEEPAVEPSRNPEVQSKSKPDMASLQAACNDIGTLYQYMVNDRLPENETEQKRVIISSEQYVVREGILYHFLDTKSKKNKRGEESFSQLVVPKCLREDIILSYHDGNAHLGFDKTYSAIRSKYYWPKMYSDIDAHVKTCNTCQKSKRNYGSDKAPLTPMPIPSQPFSRLHMDIMGPLTTSSEGHKYILLVVCAFTGWCECFPLKTQESSVIAQILFAEIFCRYGAPDIIVSDRGKNFMSRLVAALCELFQVTRHHSSAFHPQTNSSVERTNQTLAQAIRSYCNVEQTDWHKQLPAIMMAFRNAQSATTGFTPYELVFGRGMRTPLDTALVPKESLTRSAQEHMQELVDSLKLTNMLVKSNRMAAQARQKKQYDLTAQEPKYHLGQQVMLRKMNITPGLSKKLEPKYEGPYYITKIGPNHTYNLRRQSNHKPLRSRVHANRLKPYHNPVLRRYKDNMQAEQRQTVIEQNTKAQNIPKQSTPLQDLTIQSTPVRNSISGTAGQQTQGNPVEDIPEPNYFVEKILASTNYKGEKLYKVKWLGKKGTTWERRSTLPEDLINNFHITHNAKGKKRKRPHKYFIKDEQKSL